MNVIVEYNGKILGEEEIHINDDIHKEIKKAIQRASKKYGLKVQIRIGNEIYV